LRQPPSNGGGPLASRPSPVPPPPPPASKPPRSPRAALEPERMSTPHLRSKRVRHPLVIVGNAIFTLLVVISVAVGGLLFVGKQRFDAAGPLAAEKVVNIPRGLGIKDISDLLMREGVIDQPYVFIGAVVVLKARGELKYGEYQFGKHASVADVVDTIIEGKVVQHAITIAEGLTSEQIVAKLLENDVLSGQIKEIPREGTLLPETYKFTRGMARDQIVQRMAQGHKRVLAEVWERRMADSPIKTPEQLVTLASIVEKETGRSDERSRVAAVFINRLKIKMRLQSDPTIIYGLTGGKGALGRPILHEIDTNAALQYCDRRAAADNHNPAAPFAAYPAHQELYFVADGARYAARITPTSTRKTWRACAASSRPIRRRRRSLPGGNRAL
jgi:UPF0755 protein